MTKSKSHGVVGAAVVFGAMLAGAGAVAAQAPPSHSPVARDKMQALAFLVGEWQGEAWMQMGPGAREEVAQREWIEWKAGGEVLLIQGRGEVSGQPVHEAIATITWDQRAGRYAMWSYRAGSGGMSPSIEVGDERVVWGFDVPNGKIRYTITLDAEGNWTEAGDYSSDGGTTWNQFLGMKLRKL